ncbi:MAG: type II toxin-antitoxin system YafQ family toxin [Fibrobacteraceae bacterium]|nr:type II toxin-antitoxin system YafQ family toxin [Fibrobacteraceae bacterium]
MSEKVYKYQIRITKKFKKSVKRATKRGKRIQKLKDIVETLAKGEELSSAYKDHALTGNWIGHRELHIEPNWLLIYKIEENILILELVDTGSHADLFGL